MQIASSDFLRDEGENGENPLWIFEYFSRNISENMHARCVREDTKQALKGNLQADACKVARRSLCGIALSFHAVFSIKRSNIRLVPHQLRIAKPLFCRIIKADHSFTSTRAGFHSNIRRRESIRNRLRFYSLLKSCMQTPPYPKCGEWYIRRHFRNHQLKACFR